MAFEYNPLPLSSSEELKLLETVKNGLRELKLNAYGSDSNLFDGPHNYVPQFMSKKELLHEIRKIIPNEVIKEIACSHMKLRAKSDYLLVETVVEKIIPQFVSPNTLIDYNFYVVGRDMSKIDSKDDERRGRADRDNHIIVLPASELKDAWREYVILDEQVDREGIDKYMPKDTDCNLSTVHRFYAVEESTSIRRGKKKNQNNGFPEGYVADKSKFQADARSKSGQEFLYKFVPSMSGLEDNPEKPRETINDSWAIRTIFGTYFESNSIALYQNFMSNYKGSCKGSLILQTLEPNTKKVETEFIKHLQSTKEKNFCKRVIIREDRSNLLHPKDVKELKKKYYLEMKIPFCSISTDVDECVGRNIVNPLSYYIETYKKINEKSDPFLYKERKEVWRDENWSFFEWALLELFKAMTSGQNLWYVGKVAKSKLKEDLDLF